MLALMDHTPDMYLDEIQDQLYTQHEVDVSLATISCTLKRLGISLKQVNLSVLLKHVEHTDSLQLSRETAERCEHARRDFLVEIGDEPAECLVCGD